MTDDRQLEWVQQNRTRRSRVRTVASAIARLAERVESNDVVLSHDVAAALVETVDNDFRQHCRVGQINRGTLTICVQDAGFLYAMRMQWATPILACLRQRSLRQNVSKVVFEASLGGVRWP